jgi:PglD N-terminal domain
VVPAVTSLVIIGAGGHGPELASLVAAVNTRKPTWDLLGFVADGEQHPERAAPRLGVPIVGGVERHPELGAAYAIGIGDPRARARIDEFATRSGCEPAILVPSHRGDRARRDPRGRVLPRRRRLAHHG